jgi:hypothetical protein
MPSSHVVPDQVDVAFDDQRAVTSAGLLPPAALAERLVLQPEIVTLLVSPMWHADGTADGRMRGQQAIGAAPGCRGPLHVRHRSGGGYTFWCSTEGRRGAGTLNRAAPTRPPRRPPGTRTPSR